MKRIIYYLAIALTVTGCYEEIIQDVTDDGFVAVIEDFADETRTSLTSGNYIAWSESDQIGVFQGVSTPDCFQVAYNSVGSTKASFDAVSTSGSNGYDKEYTENIAIYPYNSKVACLTNKVSGGVVYSYTIKSVQYPETQTYKENSFPSGALVMAAITEGLEDRNLKFRAAGSVLRFKVKGTTVIKSITVIGNSDEALSGVAAVGVQTDGSAPTVSMGRVPSPVILDCGRGVSLNENKPTVFMVCIPPTYFKNGFTVTFTDVNGEEDVRTVTKSLDVQRGHIFGMSEIVFGESAQSGENDYIDEYGINHGSGVEIDGVIWAPVNCGYHKIDYKYGKLYQWGRRYGQGYDNSDASVPTLKLGPVSLSIGQSSSNMNVFYTVTSSPDDWLSPQNDKLWNSGTEDNPVKTEYDPCPVGWRVPTYAELDELRSYKSSWTTSDGQEGYWFSGSTSYSSTVAQVFFPAAGSRYYDDGNVGSRGDYGHYWSSRPYSNNAYYLYFYSSNVFMNNTNRANGYSVRCVQDDAELIPVSSLTLSKTSLSLDVAKTATLSATITPSNASHQSAHWWSDNENIATVDQNGKVTAVSAGTATITAMAGMQTATCTVKVRDSEPEGPSASKADDLASGKGNANCYIVSRSGDYKFRPVKGNSTGSVGKVASVQVLWESFGTSKLPSTGDLISAVVYDDDYIVFSTVDNFREGNAVIAAKNSSGTILWSWHIWMTDNPSEHIYANGAGTMMDRNLGALSATPGDVGALGLLYQWGRKDPFLGSSSISSNTVAKSTGSWPSAVSSNSSNGTISYAVEHPMTFISYNTQNSDWLYTGNSSTDNTRWSSEKGLYDPCPAGWRVPDGGSDGIWTKAGIPSSNTYDGSNEGMIFSSAYCGSSAWYPAAGFRSNQGGSLYNVGYNGTTGLYWAVTPNGSNAQAFVFDAYSSVLKNNGRVRAYGQSVRCCKETQTKSGD